MEKSSDAKPTIFYKFHSYNTYLIQLLTSQHFYCATYDQLNDPYDCRIRLSSKFIRDFLERKIKIGDAHPHQLWLKLLNELDPTTMLVEEMEATIDERMEVIGHWHDIFVRYILEELNSSIVSFTVNENLSDNDLLMWAHYSYSSHGVKLKFDFGDGISRHNILKLVEKVTYDEIQEVDTKQEMYKALFKKARGWQYENEYRLIRADGEKQIFERETLKEIIFGYNMKKEDRNSLVKLTTKLGYKCDFFKLIFRKGKLIPSKLMLDPNNEHRIIEE